jgi:hypothetical protein
MWARGYFCATVGAVDEATIKASDSRYRSGTKTTSRLRSQRPPSLELALSRSRLQPHRDFQSPKDSTGFQPLVINGISAMIHRTSFLWREHMKVTHALATILILTAPACAQAPAGAGASGTGPYAAPGAAAYQIIDNAAYKIVADNGLNGKTVVIYDPQLFGLVSTYQTTVEHLRKTMKAICPAAAGAERAIAPTLDIGAAASGLAALLTALTPSYAIQGQALPFDTSALIAAFAKEAGVNVVFPAYLLPAAKMNDVTCKSDSETENTSSLVDLWYGAAAQVSPLQSAIQAERDPDKKKALRDKLDAYLKIAETYLAIDKGTSMLAKLLVVESLIRLVPANGGVSVIDLKLDAVGMESITRTWLGTKKTSFASSVLAQLYAPSAQQEERCFLFEPCPDRHGEHLHQGSERR